MKKILIALLLLSSFGYSQTTSFPQLRLFKQTITAAQMATIGSVPVTLLSAPSGSRRYIVFGESMIAKRSGGTTDYAFATAQYINLIVGATIYNSIIGVGWLINDNGRTFTTTNNGIDEANFGTGVTLTTNDGSNPTAGDRDVMITFLYYTIPQN